MKSRPDRREQRNKDAVVRQNAYNALTIPQRIELAKGRPGDSKREIERLEGKLKRKVKKKRVKK